MNLLAFRPLHRAAGLSALVLLGCSEKAAPPAPPSPEVTYVVAQPATVEEHLPFVGQVEAYRTVQVRAQASGVIIERPFTEGAAVRAGDVLYRIDPVTADADARAARGRLAEARARLSNAELMVSRLRPLLEGNAVAKQDVDNAESQLLQARAAVEQAQGAVDAAEKRLSETVVRAEIAGRVGKTNLEVGARVSGMSDLLTTIDVVDPVYVSFRPSAAQQYRWSRDARVRRELSVGGKARVIAQLPDDSEYGVAGQIDFIDPVVDPRTGTQQYRAKFANPDRLLVPGQFVQVRIRGVSRDSAILVPQRAVLQQMGKQIVYVIDDSNKVSVREVKATGWSGGDWLIESGLSAGERVVVDGTQKIGPGASVRATALGERTGRDSSAGATQ